jgi:hypothetical protein
MLGIFFQACVCFGAGAAEASLSFMFFFPLPAFPVLASSVTSFPASTFGFFKMFILAVVFLVALLFGFASRVPLFVSLARFFPAPFFPFFGFLPLVNPLVCVARIWCCAFGVTAGTVGSAFSASGNEVPRIDGHMKSLGTKHMHIKSIM